MIRQSESHEEVAHLPLISAANYEAFRQLMNTRDRPKEIPDTFSGWSASLHTRMAKIARAILILITPEQFQSYCHTHSCEPDFNSLNEMAADLANAPRSAVFPQRESAGS